MSMTNEQIQALKAAAEKIINEMVVIRDNGQCGRAIFTWKEFDALLAKMEADKALIAELGAIAEHAKRDSALVEQAVTYIDEQNKRIAELEARTLTVKLPKTFWYEHDDLCRDVAVLEKRLVKKVLHEACAAAGITLVVGGEE